MTTYNDAKMQALFEETNSVTAEPFVPEGFCDVKYVKSLFELIDDSVERVPYRMRAMLKLIVVHGRNLGDKVDLAEACQ